MPAANKIETISRIGDLIKSGKTNPEISKEVGKSIASVSLIAQRHFGGNPNYRHKKTKHAHLRAALLLYRMTHTDQEAMEHFKLSPGEMKSCLTYAYRLEEYSHLRKDTRNRNKWTGEELISMLRYSGILRRDKIARIINRGSARVVKEKYEFLNVSSRNINGVNLTQFRNMFGFEPKFQIRGEAGPGSFGTKRNRFVIVPWSYVCECYLQVPHDPALLKIFQTYALFQRFIWSGEPWGKMLQDKTISEFLFMEAA
jgi:hypothetical protein